MTINFSHNVILVGNIGNGKSTLSNKLYNILNHGNELFNIQNLENKFIARQSAKSVTTKIQAE